MGRSAQAVSDGPNGQQRGIDAGSLDDELASILIDIEQETIPKRILHLASALQHAMRQRDWPN